MTTITIPVGLQPCFQEYNFADLDPQQHQALIIERTLAYGNRTELRWLFDTYGQSQISDWVQTDGHRRLPRRRYNLWCVLFDLPVHPPQRGGIWPY